MITSKDNSLIKHIKSLEQKKYRDINNEYIVEGIKMVKEAILIPKRISNIIISEKWLEMKNEIELSNLTDKIDVVSEKIFETLSDTVTPQGILAIVKKDEKSKLNYKSNVIFALDNIQDPGNLGTIIRTLDSAGYTDLILSEDTVDCFNPKVVRSTMGAIFRLNIHIAYNLEEELLKLKNNDFKIIATDLNTNKYYYDLNFENKMVIVIGNESKGVKLNIKELSDEKIKIPMLGKTESLNAAVATSIIAYEGVRQKIK